MYDSDDCNVSYHPDIPEEECNPDDFECDYLEDPTDCGDGYDRNTYHSRGYLAAFHVVINKLLFKVR